MAQTRSIATTFATIIVTSALASTEAQAQKKALVYCPAASEAECNFVADTLRLSGVYSTVDKADASTRTGVTVSLNSPSLDLAQYSVFFITSGIDGSSGNPFTALRTAASGANRPKFTSAITGRVVAFSGMPDRAPATPTTTHTDRRKLIMNFAKFASEGSATGLVVLGDNTSTPYTWVPIVAGPADGSGILLARQGNNSYEAITAKTPLGSGTLLTGVGMYAGIASPSFQDALSAVGSNATVHAVGGSSTAGTRVVLVTYRWSATQNTSLAVANASGAFGGSTSLTATLTANNVAVAGQSISFKLKGAAVGSAVTGVDGVATLASVSLANISGGTHDGAVEASFAGTAGYVTSSGAANLTVGKADQTITFAALATSAAFGDQFSVGPTASSGLPVTVAAAGACTIAGGAGTTIANGSTAQVKITSGDGTCTLTASQAGSDNYNAATAASGSSLIRSVSANKAAQTITFGTLSDKTFGNAPFSVSATAAPSNLAVTFSAKADSKCTVVGNTVTITGAGSCTVVAAQAGNASYNAATEVEQSFTIEKATPTVTVAGGTYTYDGQEHPATGTVVGVDGKSFATPAFTYTVGGANAPVNFGTYTAAASFAGNADYKGASATGTATITINKKPASVTPTAASKVYGDTDPTLVGTRDGFVTTDNITASYTRTTGNAVGASYTISATLEPAAKLGNYDVTYNTATFTINKRPASVTPTAASKTYGDPEPVAFGGTTSGFLEADNVTAAYSRAAGETVVASGYAISAKLSPVAALGNYDITYNTAVFTINPKAASVTPAAASKIYGAPEPTFTGTLSGFLPADNVAAAYTRTAGENVVGSPYAISAELSPKAVLTNYTITYNTAQFTINPAPATITLSNLVQSATQQGNPTITTNPSGVTTRTTYFVNNVAQTTRPTAVGVYFVKVEVDTRNYVGPAAEGYYVIYDPSAGFVTGGGWIMSEPGAYTADPTATGKANFGFVSKYQRGANVPTGNTEFQFQAVGMNFKSSVYEWLVVSGTQAQFKGEGTIASQPGQVFGFILTAIDNGPNGDAFRIKIYRKGAETDVIYDNGRSQSLGGTTGNGSIQIHSGR
jgi:hypothetical protein